MMQLSGLLASLQKTPTFQQIWGAIQGGTPILDQALPKAAHAYVAAALSQQAQRPILMVTALPDRAYNLTQQLPVWLPQAVVSRFAEAKPAFYERSPWSEETVRARLETLGLLLHWDEKHDSPPIIVVSARALMQKTLPLREFRLGSRKLRVGQATDADKLIRLWLELGYEQASIVSQAGHFSRRGGILDVFPPTEPQPIRIEFFGDEVESLRRFDPATQRSQEPLESFVFSPTREALPKYAPQVAEKLEAWFATQADQTAFSALPELEALRNGTIFPLLEFYMPWLYPQGASLLDYLPEQTLVLVDDWAAVRDTIADLEEQALESRAEKLKQNLIPSDMPPPYHTWDDLYDDLLARRPLHLGRSENPTADDVLGSLFAPMSHFGGQLKLVAEYLTELRPQRDKAILVTRQADHLRSLWSDRLSLSQPRTQLRNLEDLSPLNLIQGELGEGWLLETAQGERIHLLTDAEIFGWQRPEPRRQQRSRPVTPEAFFADLEIGDYVVHIEHGIGRFAGLIKRSVKGEERELLQIEYASNDRLFVPIHQADRLTRYVGTDDHVPSLTRLGTQEWVKIRQKATQAAEDIAEELLQLYANREISVGHAFAPDTPWQHELEASFPYVETEDQLKAILDVKADMEAEQPMDRLICGDVGFGKTEIAIRAAFKAVMDSKQVALLAPTTLLTNQHYHTFSSRLKPFGVQVELLSRFRTAQQQDVIIKKLKRGEVDIIIGTHRLLGQDVVFKDLGLVVIDEEQRFGITHKEHLKKLRNSVDVLTLTATPIPRTLYTGITGIRDISIINTAPDERLPVATYVGNYDSRTVLQAIRRELERGGQVYFIHNRIQSIDSIAQMLQDMVPEARVGVGHSQMTNFQLESIMEQFSTHQIDILVSTAIVESGLDIPNANTLIIDRSDWFGLADLYQLRGRVGRGSVQSYAYFFHPPFSHLTDDARARLEVISEETQLGAGLSIAMRDLELRGAGDLLGKRQSGHIAAVGFHLYTQLLTQAVQRLKRKSNPTTGSSSPAVPSLQPALIIDLPLPAFIPQEYIGENALRIQLYRRLADLHSLEAIDEMQQELFDRFGDLPAAVEGLIYQLRVKILASQVMASAIIQDQDKIGVRLPYLSKLDRQVLQNHLGSLGRVSREAVWLNLSYNAPDWQTNLLDLLEALKIAPDLIVERAATGL